MSTNTSRRYRPWPALARHLQHIKRIGNLSAAGPVRVIYASPDCTEHAVRRGAK